MATTDEIEQRVGDADSVRTARRVAAATRVGELARYRAGIAEQLADVEQELGTVLAESSDVIEIDELARFTDVPAADLAQWLNSRKTARAKRKRSSVTRSANQETNTPKPSPDGPPIESAPGATEPT